jgi:hypothetical protein
MNIDEFIGNPNTYFVGMSHGARGSSPKAPRSSISLREI